jgi:hypothetical protein
MFALQAAVARTELEALERKRGGFSSLSGRARAALRDKALRWRQALGGQAVAVGRSLQAVAERVAARLPVRADGTGKMLVDLQALKRVIMRCGIMGIWV